MIVRTRTYSKPKIKDRRFLTLVFNSIIDGSAITSSSGCC
jgi:hypothetical protein